MKKEIDTELQALKIIAEMIMTFGKLHILTIGKQDWKKLRTVRRCLEKVIHDNSYRMDYNSNKKKP